MPKRVKTDYPGVFYREARRIGQKGLERVYYVIFKRHGEAYEEKVGRQYQDAMTPAKAARIRGELIEGKRPLRKEIKEAEKNEERSWTFDLLWDEYRKRNPIKSIKSDKSRYDKYLKPKFGNKEPRFLVQSEVDVLRLEMLKDKSPQTVKLTLALLRRIANFGNKKDLCDPIPFIIEMPEVDNLKTEDLTKEQLEKLLKAIEKDDHLHAGTMMKLVLFTGMRRGELFKLKWKDLDFDRGFITIRDPKGGKSQKIPLNDGARETLLNHIEVDSPYVFPGRGGSQRTDINKAVNRIKKAAGLPEDFRPLHGLRHVYASMLASSGKVDLYTLQKLLTHKSPEMTQRYAHLRDEALKKASSVADDLINGFQG
jgi:integrase